MCAEWDGSASVRGHRTMNLSVPVVGVGLWVPWEPLWGHVLNICRPYFPRDEWRFEFPPNRHGSASVRGHRTMNLPVPVVSAGLWVPWELLWGHVLNICRPYFPRDEWRFKFPPNHHLIPSFKTVIPRVSFWFFLVSYQKSRNLFP
jgi:hypothetical protein